MSGDPLKSALQVSERALKSADYSAALEAAETALEIDPASRDALYYKAVSQRYLSDFQAALHTLHQLREAAPGFGRGYQELGHNYLAVENAEDAFMAYQKAVQRNPALIASWQRLHQLAEQLGVDDIAESAAQQLNHLRKLPPVLVSVSSMFSEGKLYKAENLCRQFLQKQPHHPEAMRLLANIGSQLNILDDAEFLLESCVEFNPEFTQARFDLVNVLHKRQKYERALQQAETLYKAHPEHKTFTTAYANANLAVGKFDKALSIYDDLLNHEADNPNLWLMKGHAQKTVGEQNNAISSYRRAASLKPQFGDAWWSLANLKTYRFEEHEIQAMETAEAQSEIENTDRFHLCFALGRCWEDREDYQKAYEYYARGNALKKSQSDYSAARTQEEFERQKKYANSTLFANGEQGIAAPDPIFIVGLPRAGSTLLEQILASHSQVDGTLELPNILAMAHRLNGRRRVDEAPRYPANLHELDSEMLQKLGQQFIDDTQIYRKGANYFTDKMPNNFRHIGLILKILPNAKIIDARRHPMACCFSGFKQLFAEGQEFTYSQEDVARYYAGYVDLMEHWEQVAPGKILRVYHENVVANTEAEIKRLLDFCELPFESACLEFHKTQRAVRTASSEQVRQPIYSSGLEHWRHFEPYLQPMQTILEPILSAYPAQL